MKILALDPATNCGWAYLAEIAVISGTWDLSQRRDESTGMKLVRFESKLAEFSDVELVVFEAARHAAPGMQGALVHQTKLQAVIERWCAQHDINYRGYSPSEIKKFITGKGNAKKDAVIAAVTARGYRPEDDNEADAIALLLLADAEYGSSSIGGGRRDRS